MIHFQVSHGQREHLLASSVAPRALGTILADSLRNTGGGASYLHALLASWLALRAFLFGDAAIWLAEKRWDAENSPRPPFFCFLLSWLWVYNCVRCLRLRESASTHTDYFWLTLFRRRHGCICFCSCCCYYGCCVILLYINCSKLRSCVFFFLLFNFFFYFLFVYITSRFRGDERIPLDFIAKMPQSQ